VDLQGIEVSVSEAIIAQIKTILESVSGVGVVHDYDRYSLSLGAYMELMKDVDGDGSVNGWTIEPEEGGGEFGTVAQYQLSHRFRIIGVYALNDEEESSKTFRALVRSIMLTFAANPTLNGAVILAVPESYAIDIMELGQVAFHQATVYLGVTEFVDLA